MVLLDSFSNFFSHFIQPDPKTALLVVINLVVIESLLSVDNAAVLAAMVMDLPKQQRKRALRIGIFFAYLFRGITLIFASFLIKVTWLKLLGGGYLVYLSGEFLFKKIFQNGSHIKTTPDGLPAEAKPKRRIPGLNTFWSTVIMVELMDITFSIDNVFAAVAFTNNIYLVCAGVFIGIITMRIVAGYFVKLLETFPFLDTVAFIVIGVLGMRLCLDFICKVVPENSFCTVLHNEHSDFYFSMLTVAIFFLPIVGSLLFNFPRRTRLKD